MEKFIQNDALLTGRTMGLGDFAENAANDPHIIAGAEFPEGILGLVVGIDAVGAVFLDKAFAVDHENSDLAGFQGLGMLDQQIIARMEGRLHMER